MKMTGDFKELSRSIKKTLELITVSFYQFHDNGVPTISLIIKGIDNEYYQFSDPKYPANWEIYLMADGTWKIV